MDLAQRDKALVVVANDAAIRSYYINLEGQTCAIGGLALSAGAHEVQLRLAGYGKISQFNLRHIRSLIEQEFGLTPDQMGHIQVLNDTIEDRNDRQQAIIDYILSLPVTED